MKIVVLTGAGMSAESGLRTFREAGGLWEDHDIMEVASPQGWKSNPELVLDFYNQRRRQLKTVEPNPGHRALVQLEQMHDVRVITQNVDDLHERAGSKNVLHLHGELRKVRSQYDPNFVLEWCEDLHLGDRCPQGGQLRPHIVWFGEAVPKMSEAIAWISECEVLMIVGTSLQVYPAAGLVGYVPKTARVYLIDPHPYVSPEAGRLSHLTVIAEVASKGVPYLVEILGKKER